MISFETPPEIDKRLDFVRRVAREQMRPQARHYDEHEHEVPWDFINLMWDTTLKTGQSFRSVTKAESRARCSGQFGSAGIRGIASTRIFFAVSAFAIKCSNTVWAETGSSSTFQQS